MRFSCDLDIRGTSVTNVRVRRIGGELLIALVAAMVAVLACSGLAGAMAPAGKRPASMGMSGVPAGAMMHMEHPTKAAWIPFAPALRPRGWRATASSATPGHPAGSVLHAGRATYWQSGQLARSVRLPQSITIRFPAPTLVSGLTYVPRTGLGAVGRFRVTLSMDGTRFQHAVAYGRWQTNASDKKVAWTAERVRAVRLTVLSVSPQGAASVAAARIVLYGAPRGGRPRNAIATPRAAAASTNPSVVGQWGPTIGFPLVPVAAALIPGNKLVVWSADEDLSFDGGASFTQTAIMDLTTGTVSPAVTSNVAHNMFCPGVSILPDGEIMVTGGISNTMTSIYNPATNTWREGPPMNIGRGYQGQTTLSDGQAFVLGGSWSGALGGKLAEVWSPTSTWRELTGVPADPIYTADAEGVYRQDNHGWFIATSGGKVFQAGPSAQMHWITTTGAGTITPAGARGSAGDEMNGNAVLYDTGKILTVGGAPDYQNSNATAVANVVDISTGSAHVTPTSSMAFPRGFANSVALPDGHVFTVGGETVPVPFSDQNSDLTPEMWDPAGGQWSAMAPQPEPRNYHSVAVLLPDGTVFSGGGGLCGTCNTNHPDGQIFYPPYLFNADGSRRARPTITAAPSSAVIGQTISVTTAGAVQSFVLMRYDEATHAVDNDQRRIPLTISSSAGSTYRLAIPSDPGIALPGPYMLFAIDADGTPSVSATISISTPPVSAPSTIYGTNVDSTGPAVYWPLSDGAGSAAADVSGNRDTGSFSSSGITYRAPSPVEATSGQGITLGGGQIVSTQLQPTQPAYAEELWFKTTSSAGGLLMRFGDSPSGANNDTDRVVYMTGGGRLSFGVWNGKTDVITTPSSYNDGSWHFAVATQGGDGMHLYVDGVQVASGTVATAQPYKGYWQLGGTINAGWPNGPSTTFSGSISDAAMYEIELTPAQVQTQYLASPVSPAVDTTTTITSDDPNPSVAGELVSIHYTVHAASGGGAPTGTVTVSDGTDSCTGTVATGSCEMTMSVTGARILTASYAGDQNYNPSVSAPAPHTVTEAPTTTVSPTTAVRPTGTGKHGGGSSGAKTPTARRKPLAHISAASETHRSFRDAAKPQLARISRRGPPVGTTFTYKLDHPAVVRLDFTRPAAGRIVGGKCVARTRRNARNRACTAIVGSLRFAGHQGLNRIRFAGWLSPTKKLGPGNYTLVMTAITADVGSTSQRLTFAILR
jgi:galactose oxidase